MSIAAWPSIDPGQASAGLVAGLAQQPVPQQDSEQQRNDHDHERTADELGQGELPAHEQGEDRRRSRVAPSLYPCTVNGPGPNDRFRTVGNSVEIILLGSNTERVEDPSRRPPDARAT
jgi:hypothetical protein